MDGGSNDDSVKVIECFNSRLTYWESTPDKGQSHALNKGFRRASGDILTWLNSDDVLMPGSLGAVARKFSEKGSSSKTWVVGGCLWIDTNGCVLKCTRARRWAPCGASGFLGVFGPSSFFSRACLESVGLLNEDLHYMMDTELWIKFARNNFRFSVLEGYVWALRLHPAAKMSGHHFQESPMANPDHSVWQKRRDERNYLRSTYRIGPYDEKKSLICSRLNALLAMNTYKSFLDTRRYSGRHWKMMFHKD